MVPLGSNGGETVLMGNELGASLAALWGSGFTCQSLSPHLPQMGGLQVQGQFQPPLQGC